MAVLVKLNEARKAFHASHLKKTGHNKFAGYYYFELGDFLVPALQICDSLKLSAVVSFGVELATMTLTDLEDGSQFVITSPMSTASLKACHEVQNLGAVQTYLRRYLWVAALEIVEHDAIDSSEGAAPKRVDQPKPEPVDSLGDMRKAELDEFAYYLIDCHQNGSDMAAIKAYYQATNWATDVADKNEEIKYVWNALKTHSKLRSAIKANRPEK